MAEEFKSRQDFEEQSRRRVSAFVASVKSSFRYLVDEYGFTSEEPEYLWFGDLRDALVRMIYRRSPIRIDIDFRPGENLLAVGLHDVTRGWAMDLEELISFRTQGSLVPVIPPIDSGLSFAEMKRRAARREQLVSEDLQSVVRELATRLRSNAADVLNGGTQDLARASATTREPTA
ncbi:MAG: hypothetical protein JO093_14110 [Acidobacteria bacterium]|nr:hypothetical protein [Acidobacteriota bacterium]MBV9186750.1 hypothetical protein [Acidobacteriota bacterium]